MLGLEEQERRTREARLLVSRPEEVFKELRSYGAQAKANHFDGDEQLEKSLLERGDPLIDLGLACYGSDKGVVSELYKKALIAPNTPADARYRKGLRIACRLTKESGRVLGLSVRNAGPMKPFLTFAFAISLATFARAQSQETVGGGSIATPAIGTPTQPAYGLGGGGFALVKNWNFGTNGTIKNISDLNKEFQYHDQFNTYHNPNYGASIVAPDSANALAGQPIEGANTAGAPVRAFFADSMQTYLVPLNGATTLKPDTLSAGSGSFQAKWTLPNGGSLLGHDIIWETRVRYVTPPYFWFGIWAAGNSWNNGAEMDLVETFGYDNGMYNGRPNTNYDGLYWHSNTVGGILDVSAYGNWYAGMASNGITSYDPTQYHIWTWFYKKDNTYMNYLDGIPIQSGVINWTVGGKAGGTPINMSFIFDATWGSPTVWNVNHSLPASALAGKYYEWNYSRVYLR